MLVASVIDRSPGGAGSTGVCGVLGDDQQRAPRRAGSRSASSAPVSAASARRSSCARPGSRSFDDLRARRHGRRRLAREHLPGRRLRRALAPVLVLVRARAPLVAPLRARRRRSSATSRSARGDFGITPHLRLGTEVLTPSFDAEAGRWTVRTDDGERARVRPPGHRLRPAHPSGDPAASGDRGLRRAGLPLGRMGPRARPGRAQGRGDRHRRKRDPVRARDRRGRRRRRRSTSARRPGSCRRPTAPTRNGSGELFRRFPARVAASRLGLFAFFELCTYGFTGHPRVLAAVRGDRQLRAPPGAARPTPTCSPGRPPTTRSAASACCSPATGTRP